MTAMTVREARFDVTTAPCALTGRRRYDRTQILLAKVGKAGHSHFDAGLLGTGSNHGLYLLELLRPELLQVPLRLVEDFVLLHGGMQEEGAVLNLDIELEFGGGLPDGFLQLS